jgi:hypothetical protein
MPVSTGSDGEDQLKVRTGIAAFALAGCALLAATGCGGHTAGKAKAPAAAAPDTSVTVLVAAAEPLHATSYRFTTTAAGITGQGAADPAAKVVTMTTGSAIDVLYLGGDLYFKYPKGLPGAESFGNGKWLHLDASKVALSKLGVSDFADPAGAYGYLKSADRVQKIGDRHYTGTLDLTRSGAAPKSAESMGEAAKAVPFEATLDDQGRLSTLDVTVKVNGTDVTTHTTFSDYGAKVAAARPADAVEAPESFYRIFSKS